MRRALRSVAALLLVALGATVAQAGWWDEAGAARTAGLSDLRRAPDRWRDVVVLIDVRLARPLDVASSPADARRTVSLLPADTSADAAESAMRAFVEHGTTAEARLAGLRRGQRIQVRAVVRDAAGGEPSVEVLGVVADGDPLTPEESAVVECGDRYLALHNPAAAESAFREVLAKRTLPQTAQASLWRKIGDACWAQRRHAQAADAYVASLAADPADDATAAKFVAARKAVAEVSKPPQNAAAVGSSAPELPPAMRAPEAPPRPDAPDEPAPVEAPPAPKPKLSAPK